MSSEIIRAVDRADPIIGSIAALAMLLFAAVWIWLWKDGRLLKQFPKKLFFLVAASSISVFAINGFLKYIARREVQTYLNNLQGADVSVNGKAIAEPVEVLSVLRSMSWRMPHHTHPEMRLRIEVRSNRGLLTLDLGRDSGRKNEYWVFYPRYYITNIDEIDRIQTHLFDSY